MSVPSKSGMLLLEVLLGIAILGIAGVGLIMLLTQTVETVRHGRDTERRVMSASHLFNRATLYNTPELDARIGRQRIGEWNLEIVMAQMQLYSLAVLDTTTGVVVLHTTVYRPASTTNGP